MLLAIYLLGSCKTRILVSVMTRTDSEECEEHLEDHISVVYQNFRQTLRRMLIGNEQLSTKGKEYLINIGILIITLTYTTA